VRGSWIDVFVEADGKTPKSLTAKDQVVVDLPATASGVGRRVTAASLQATGEPGKGLTQARFEGTPAFEETPALNAAGAPRPVTGWADVLVLRLAGRLDAIDRAEFQGRANVRSGDARGVAELIQYDEPQRLLRLLPASKASKAVGRLETADITVDGRAIDASLDSDNIVATGAVTTQMRPRAEKRLTTGGSLFTGDAPINGAAETFRYTKSSGLATYEGTATTSARLWQGQSELSAQHIALTDTSRNVSARVGVDSIFWVEPKPGDTGAAALKRYRSRADTLSYDEARRTAVYTGTLVILTSEDGDIEAPRISVTLAPDTRRVQSLTADGDGLVFATFAGGYEAVGERLTYDASTETHTLFGKPARVKEPNRPAAGPPAPAGRCLVHIGPEVVVKGSARDVSMPGPGNALQSTEEIRCDESLRPKR
jgi:lipopolysaccharide export system protein LptA